MDISILVKSSSNPNLPYSVHFSYDNDLIRVHCTCPAGNHKRLCKHITKIIDNDNSILYNNSDKEILSQVQEVLNVTSLPIEFVKFTTRLKEIESKQHELKNELQILKNNFANKLINVYDKNQCFVF